MSQLDLDRLGVVRNDWSLDEARAIFALPMNDLLYHAQRVHRMAFDPNKVQVSTLLSVKTGACPASLHSMQRGGSSSPPSRSRILST